MVQVLGLTQSLYSRLKNSRYRNLFFKVRKNCSLYYTLFTVPVLENNKKTESDLIKTTDHQYFSQLIF
jgi:hypothetical protein